MHVSADVSIDHRPQCVAHAHQVCYLHSMVGRRARTRTLGLGLGLGLGLDTRARAHSQLDISDAHGIGGAWRTFTVSVFWRIIKLSCLDSSVRGRGSVQYSRGSLGLLGAPWGSLGLLGAP